MTEKKAEQRIVDKPTKEQVKQLLDKAKKAAQEKQKQTPDKLDLVLDTLNKYTQKVDRIETILSANDTGQQKAQTQDKPTSEEVLRQAEAEQEKAQGKQKQPQQLTQEQYQKLPDSQKVKILEQQLQAGQPQPGSPQSAWLLGKLIDNVSPVVTAALQSGKGNSSSVSSFFQGLKDYGQLENAFLNNFFRFFKFLSPNDQAKGAKNILEQAGKLPEGQIRRDEGRITE